MRPKVKSQYFFHYRCGLRGAYLELVGFSKEVKHQFRNFMSPSVAPTTIGQVSFQNVFQAGIKNDARKI